ncbi:hypothetical protein FYK55_22400 [Roseiconus nitratireducens]|uniref:Uncharacterized protein n=1 Tax=Roseiconus nitratireducens TaxID=2605748 RepID=A0A5M6CY86_9BACT|nr:hypothetical protein [Roseiconus nitratireducens]KAA5540063.1 hypothetical protein FYK55_22400 [Roseiconus nitratireducens]
MWLRWIKRVLLVGAVACVLMGLAAGWAFRQSRKVPEFYERAVELPSRERLVASSERMQAEVQQLQEDVGQLGHWQASFTADQLNAWLVEQLPQKFPEFRARGLQDPRIVIDGNTLRIAARFKDKRFDAVLSCELEVQLTDQPNCLAIRVQRIRAGALPLPLSQFQEKIKQFSERTNLNLQWETGDEETVALVDIPLRYHGQESEDVVLESIELTDDRVSVAGRTGSEVHQAYAPQGPVYTVAQNLSEDPSLLDPPAEPDGAASESRPRKPPETDAFMQSE